MMWKSYLVVPEKACPDIVIFRYEASLFYPIVITRVTDPDSMTWPGRESSLLLVVTGLPRFVNLSGVHAQVLFVARKSLQRQVSKPAASA